MLRGVIYKRLSAKSKGQRNAPNLEAQETDCRQLAEDLGAVVVATLTEYGQSAFDRENPDDRPAYAELCDLVRAREVDVVLAWHSDRLWRDDLEKALFVRDARKAGLKLVVTKTAKLDPQNPDDEFMLDILTAVAKKESADKRRRIRRKMEANAAAGLPHGSSHRPFGYDKDRVTVLAHEAIMVREVARRLLAGETLRSVTAWANEAGFRTVTGREWTTDRIRTMALNYRYSGQRAIGKGKHARLVADAAWDGIITRAETDKLRALLLDDARRTNRSARKYLLSQHIICGRCGKRMHARPRSDSGAGPKGQRIMTYICTPDPGKGGCGLRVVADPLHDLIVELVAEHIADPQVRAELRATSGDDGTLSAELAEIDAKSATLAAEWAAGDLDDAGWSAARRVLTERRSRLAAQVKRTSTLPEAIAPYVEDPERLVGEWPELSFDGKRAVLAAVLDGIVIGPGRRGATAFDPDRILEVRWKAAS